MLPLIASSSSDVSFRFAGATSLPNVITFTRASIANDYSAAGVLESNATDVARFDYVPTTLAARGLLIEPARTNLLLQSKNMQTSWFNNGITITQGAATGIDGTASFIKIAETATTGTHQQSSNAFSVTLGTQYTISVVAKKAERNNLQIVGGLTGFGVLVFGNFDLNTGTAGTMGAGVLASGIADAGNGAYRCWISGIAVATTVSGGMNVNIGTSTSDARLPSYTGVAGSGLFVVSAQAEAGTAPTSIIDTTTAQVTRALDNASITNLATIGYNQTAGTVIWEGSFQGNDATFPDLFRLSNAGATDYIEAFLNTNNTVGLNITTASANQVNVTTANTITIGTTFKAALAWSATGYSFCLNGGTIVTGGAFTQPTVDRLGIGGNTFGGNTMSGWVRQISYTPTRLTDSQLQALST